MCSVVFDFVVMFVPGILKLLTWYFMLQACLVLQKRHLPDQPLEYLLKLRCETKSGFKYRERWIAASRLCAEFAVGAALIKQFEASKVGQLAVDTYLSKRRSLPSPVLSSRDHQIVDVRHKDGNVHSLKRKSCDDLNALHGSSNGFDSIPLESLKSTDNYVVNNSASALHLVTGTTPLNHKPLPVSGTTNQPVVQQKHFAKRLLLCNRVPRPNWSKNKSEDFKLPKLVQCKPLEQKSSVISCKCEDSDSEDDVRYSLATDHSDGSSNSKLSSYAQKKRRKLASSVNGVKKNKNYTVDSNQPSVNGDPEVQFKSSSCSTAQPSLKAGIATLQQRALFRISIIIGADRRSTDKRSKIDSSRSAQHVLYCFLLFFFLSVVSLRVSVTVRVSLV